MSRFIVGAVLAALCIVLGVAVWYTWPAIQSATMIEAFIPNLVSLILEVGIVAGILSYIERRRWRETRNLIESHVAVDILTIVGSLYKIFEIEEAPDQRRSKYIPESVASWAKRQSLSEPYDDVRRHLASRELVDKLAILSPALDADLATTAGLYIDARSRLKCCLDDLTSEQFLGKVEADFATDAHAHVVDMLDNVAPKVNVQMHWAKWMPIDQVDEAIANMAVVAQQCSERVAG